MKTKYALIALAASTLVASPAFAEGEIQTFWPAPEPCLTCDAATATVYDGQSLSFQDVWNDKVTNSASLEGNALKDASGNIGVNVSAGTNNQQANGAAIASANGDFKNFFVDPVEKANAAIEATQTLMLNNVDNDGTTNVASLSDNAMKGVSGSVGLNIVAGDVNQQKNDLAIAVVQHDGAASASTGASQRSCANDVDNEVYTERIWCFTFNTNTTNTASLSGDALQNASGNIGVNMTSGNFNQQFNGLSVASAQK